MKDAWIDSEGPEGAQTPQAQGGALLRLAWLTLAAVLVVGCGGAGPGPEAVPGPEPTAEATSESDPEPSPESEPEPESAPDEDEPAFKLAAIDTDDREPDEATVSTYRDALDAADDKCDGDEEATGDVAVRAWQVATDNELETSILEMLHALDEAVPGDAAPMGCTEVAAALLTMMQDGG